MKNRNYSVVGSLAAFIILMMVLSGCKSEIVSPVMGGVHGSITYLNSDGKAVGMPGVTVYLLSSDIKPDTVNYDNNKKAILDSTVTDSNGGYKFENLKDGDYYVIPLPGVAKYIFTYDNSADSSSFSINDKKRSYIVNFTAPDPIMGQGGTPFAIKIIMKNFPKLENGWYFIFSINRVDFFGFFPSHDMDAYKNAVGNADNFSQPFTYYYDYGFTSILYTLTNKFDFKFSEVTLNSDLQNVYKNSYEFSYDLTLSFCPPLSTFEYDWKAHTFNRIQ